MFDTMETLGLKRPDLFRQAAFINGEWRTRDQGIAVDNPATGMVIGHVPDLDAADTEAAVAAAHAALGPWKAMTAGARGAILRRWHDLVVAHAGDLARILTVEQGKPLHESQGEIAYAAAYIDWFAEEGRRARGDIIPPHQADKRLLVTREAIGVVGAVTPWNVFDYLITFSVSLVLEDSIQVHSTKNVNVISV